MKSFNIVFETSDTDAALQLELQIKCVSFVKASSLAEELCKKLFKLPTTIIEIVELVE